MPISYFPGAGLVGGPSAVIESSSSSHWRVVGFELSEAQLKRKVGKDHPTEKILAFLYGGALVQSGKVSKDPLIDSSLVVPGGFRTDGEWIWQEKAIYYLEHHGLLPPQAFLDHMVEQYYQVGEVDNQQIQQAAEHLASY